MAEVTVRDITDAIARQAPWSKAAGWDPVGLQLGDSGAAVRRVAVCHEVTEAVVAAVEADPVDLVVAYHPLLFKPTVRLVAGRSPAGRAYRLVRAGVALAIAHTNFDVASGGVADQLADALHLEETTGFGPVSTADSVKIVTFVPTADVERVAAALAAAGGGHIGNYRSCSFRSDGIGAFEPASWASPAAGRPGAMNHEPEVRLEMVAPRGSEPALVAALLANHPYEEPAYDIYDRRGNDGMVGRVGRVTPGTTVRALAQLAATVLGGTVRLSWAGDAPGLVAVVPGSGAGYIGEAIAAGAGVLVTGDVGHHDARRALDAGLSVIDPGHARTERPGVAALLNLVTSAAPEAVDLTAIDPSPWEGVQ